MGRIHDPLVIFMCLLCISYFVTLNAIENAMVHEAPIFSYLKNATNGPENWGQLNTEWMACRTGKLQSPIDLQLSSFLVLPSLGDLRRTYKPAPAVIKNRGHAIMVEWKGDAGGAIINGMEYKLSQAHWHTPSEHTLNGKSMKMEMHLVHKNSEEQMAVISILYDLGHPDPFVARFLETIKASKEEGTDVGVVDPWEIKFGSRKYYRYIGSLTTPPCTEGVVWTVLKKVRTVSMEQINALRAAVNEGFEDNARPTQRLEGRRVNINRPLINLI